MVLEPVVPLTPVKVKDNVVDPVDWSVVIMTLVIWELVMSPLSSRLTVPPLSVIADTVDGEGTGVGVGVGVGIAIGVGVGVGVDVGVGVGAGEPKQ